MEAVKQEGEGLRREGEEREGRLAAREGQLSAQVEELQAKVAGLEEENASTCVSVCVCVCTSMFVCLSWCTDSTPFHCNVSIRSRSETNLYQACVSGGIKHCSVAKEC